MLRKILTVQQKFELSGKVLQLSGKSLQEFQYIQLCISLYSRMEDAVSGGDPTEAPICFSSVSGKDPGVIADSGSVRLTLSDTGSVLLRSADTRLTRGVIADSLPSGFIDSNRSRV